MRKIAMTIMKNAHKAIKDINIKIQSSNATAQYR